jgi:glycine cleavage system H lipoate-binding protein
MSRQSPDPRFRIVPPGDLECVWMSAGLLSYHLCDREFDCERCPLDAALRTHFHRGDAARAKSPAPRVEPGLPAGDRRYSRQHCWVRPFDAAPGAAGTRMVRVGIEPGLAAVLPLPRAVVMPRVGETVERGLAHLWIVADGGTYAIAAPLDGTISSINPRLAERPGLATTAGLEEGWLYELAVTDAAMRRAALMSAEEARDGYAGSALRFRTALVRELNRNASALGPTLPDGGGPLADLARMVGPARYLELLAQAYG